MSTPTSPDLVGLAPPVTNEVPSSVLEVAACVIAYEAAATIEPVIAAIPVAIEGRAVRLFVADDASADQTADLATAACVRAGIDDAVVVRNPQNLGYGGNQLACFRWALAAGVDVVAVVHGDGQYPPDSLPELVAPILAGAADVVLASRMLVPGGAKAGGMPRHRRIGNALLSRFQNRITGADLSEWHTGLRAYRVASLGNLDLEALPAGFDFDTAITLALLSAEARFAEIPIATYYGDEVSRVPVWRTGLRIAWRTIAYRRAER